jgi:dissimilatory sulfite reductase (desulfoviridin) alpha/beta subunit
LEVEIMACLTVSAADEKRVKALGFLSNKGTDNFSGRIITVNGKITAAQNKCLSEAAELFRNGVITFTTRLTVEVQGIPYYKIEDFRAYIAMEGLVTGGTGSKVRPVVSCKGTTCQYGLIDTFALSEEIHERFYNAYSDVKLPHKFKIAVGGCPNNCVKPDLNDLGIIGQRTPDFDEESCNGCKKCSVEEACPIKAAKVTDGILEINKDECNNCGRCIGKCRFDAIEDGKVGYKVYLGGRWGKRVAQGKPLNKIFASKEEGLGVIEKAILLYREQGKTGERFSQTIERLGFENIQAQLLSNDLLERRREILEAKLHVVGGATC